MKKIFEFYGIQYNPNIEIIKDELIVFDDIDDLYINLTNKNVYDILPEEVICLRMISEYAVRNESTDIKRFKEKNLKRVKNSRKLKELSVFIELLNAITHSDEDELWPELCLNDIKAIPKIIIYQIINIIK